MGFEKVTSAISKPIAAGPKPAQPTPANKTLGGVIIKRKSSTSLDSNPSAPPQKASREALPEKDADKVQSAPPVETKAAEAAAEASPSASPVLGGLAAYNS